MTKEEAIECIWRNKGINTIGKVDATELIKKVFNDFEVRDCDNCKHYRTGDAKVYPELCLGCKWFHTDNFIEMEEEDD